MPHQGQHITWHASPHHCQPIIDMYLSSSGLPDSLLHKQSTELVAQIHPKSSIMPMPHTRRYLHMIMRTRSVTGLILCICHLLFVIMIYIWIVWWW